MGRLLVYSATDMAGSQCGWPEGRAESLKVGAKQAALSKAQGQHARVAQDELVVERQAVCALWREVFGVGA